jgi:hypothetical protein
VGEAALWRFFREVHAAVAAANRGEASQPYRRGRHVVSALAGDVEVTLKDVSEEDAILIASELRSYGVHVVVRGSVVCPRCGARVPEQAHCIACRAPLTPTAAPPPQ